MSSSIGQRFNFQSLLRFSLPTIVMMVCMSLYTMVDGFFVSRFVGSDALAAVNIAYPLIGIIVGIGVMLGTGGSAIIANQMGQGRFELARENFTRVLVFGFLFGLGLSAVFFVALNPLLTMLGASERLMRYCQEYMWVLLPFMAPQILQLILGVFFVTAGKPKIGLWLTMFAGVLNMVLDYVFIARLQWGIAGAAWATAAGYMVIPVFALFYFSRPRTELYFVKHKFNLQVILYSCGNGSSEMVSSLANSVITWLMNLTMLRFAGEDGVAAVTVVLYTQFLFSAIYLGFANGVAPVLSYNYGKGDYEQLKRLFSICLKVIGIASVSMVVLAVVLADPIVGLFLERGSRAHELTYYGYLLYSVNYLFAGINIFGSSLFTALGDGKVSAQISFVRTFGLTVVAILLFSWLWQETGLWLSTPAAELVTLLMVVFYFRKYREKYHY